MRRLKRKKKEVKRQTARERLAEAADVSKEIILDVPKLVFIGNREAAVENYKGISEYTANKIAVETKRGRICMEGESLEVKTIADDMLCITGKIKKTEFVGEVG